MVSTPFASSTQVRFSPQVPSARTSTVPAVSPSEIGAFASSGIAVSKTVSASAGSAGSVSTSASPSDPEGAVSLVSVSVGSAVLSVMGATVSHNCASREAMYSEYARFKVLRLSNSTISTLFARSSPKSFTSKEQNMEISLLSSANTFSSAWLPSATVKPQAGALPQNAIALKPEQ